MKSWKLSLLVLWFSLGAAGCSPDDAAASREAMDARLEAQAAEHLRLDREHARTLQLLAERMERLADTMSASLVEPVAAVPSAAAQSTFEASVDRRETIAKDELFHSPASPVRELELQRRTAIWLAAMVGGVIAVAAALRLRSRSSLQRVTEPAQDLHEEVLDTGAWNEASILTEAVTPRAEAERAPFDHEAASAQGRHRNESIQTHGVETKVGSLLATEVAAVAHPIAEVARQMVGPACCTFLVDSPKPNEASGAIESYLRHDPRVLQKPKPVVRTREGGVCVECALLPGLPDGEREHLRAILARLASTR